ncbi:MAG: DUF3536 domain-containing protein [Deltaproteobacteria bacterium]|nr:DUF3536 domain-containing protein [Deltaproteobacteria bacterium]
MPAIVIHGHFYQPPREDPATGLVPRQPSAAPFHDWNQRITDECYRPNLAARILGEHGEVVRTLNTWERISFDVGPTLLRWMALEAPAVLEGIVAADAASVVRLGHGNAMAQGYHHAILPLASERDRRTEVRWGLADFRRRFGRESEGFWLPECAVDEATLEVLAEEGVRFVVLAPEQCASVRANGEWRDVTPETLDTGRAYRIPLPSGRSIAAFFYDAGPAQGVAFGGWLDNGEAMAHRLAEREGLVHFATDGESYGHHHRYGEMALAYALETLEALGVAVTNYGAWLAAHPPELEARVVSPSAWSCAHGVGRWSRNCGCAIDPARSGKHQWRATLRGALDALRERLDEVYEARMRSHGEDPWAARDRWIERLLDDESAGRPIGAPANEVETLLELANHRLMMFTSCGWFFDDPAGIEPVQLLRYARRAIELCVALGGPELSADFRRDLGDIAEVWDGL